jgi:intein/homing endonuclease
VKFAPQIRLLLTQGLSINKIRQRTGAAKSTIYFHYKRMYGRKTLPIQFNFNNREELGEFLGIFAGDGNCYRRKNYGYIIRTYTGAYEKEYIRYLQLALSRWFGKKPSTYSTKYKGNESCVIFYYMSSEIHLLLKTHLFWEGKKGYSVRLKALNLGDSEFNRGFLRGLIDTDGSYYAPKRRVSFSSVSPYLADQAHLIMMSFGLSPRRYLHKTQGRAPLHTLALHGKEAKSFLEQVRPNNPNKAPLVYR